MYNMRIGKCGHKTKALYSAPDRDYYCFRCADKMWKIFTGRGTINTHEETKKAKILEKKL